MESLRLLLQAHQPRLRPSLEDAGTSTPSTTSWSGDDKTMFLSFLGFLSGFFFSQPQARIPYPISPFLLLTPVHALTPLVLGPQPTLGGSLGDSVPWSS